MHIVLLVWCCASLAGHHLQQTSFHITCFPARLQLQHRSWPSQLLLPSQIARRPKTLHAHLAVAVTPRPAAARDPLCLAGVAIAAAAAAPAATEDAAPQAAGPLRRLLGKDTFGLLGGLGGLGGYSSYGRNYGGYGSNYGYNSE